MNKHNKNKFKEAVSTEIDKCWLNSISFSDNLKLLIHVLFKTRRGCLFVSCLHAGMSGTAAFTYAFNYKISDVADMLNKQGWQVSFGKLD